MASNIFAMLFNYHHYLVPDVFITPKGNPYPLTHPLKSYYLFSHLPGPSNH